jgi:hypothetical protein
MTFHHRTKREIAKKYDHSNVILERLIFFCQFFQLVRAWKSRESCERIFLRLTKRGPDNQRSQLQMCEHPLNGTKFIWIASGQESRMHNTLFASTPHRSTIPFLRLKSIQHIR